MEISNDYRRWLAFNDNLIDRGYGATLYQAIAETTSLNNISCEMSDESDIPKYRIQDSTISSSLLLIEQERANMLAYLKKHYLPAEHVEKSQPTIDNNPHQVAELSQEQTATAISIRTRPYFFNKNIRKHVLGYAIIGVIILEFFIIPTNVFDVKFPDFSKFIWVALFSGLTYFAVRNYKAEFLIGGIRYGTVWSITFWLYTIIFLAGGIQIAIIDFVQGTSGIGISIIMIIIILGAGYVSGWILSFPIYFMAGGKIVTDPNAVRFKE